ncbi:hypothetical protein FACS1894137_01750 [Spirochaetia bacterium]|nr:hypothetical protein FACS1894137_01750 [Spirochaetia bacterium]
MKKFIGLVFFMFVIGSLFAQESVYYHIQVFARTGSGAGTVNYQIDDGSLVLSEGYYQFYHADNGYAFFVYMTRTEASAVTPPAQVSKVFDWSGARRDLFDQQIDKIVTTSMLTMPSEVKKLRAVLEMKLLVPRS